MKRRYVVDLDALVEQRNKLARELDELNEMVTFVGKMDKAGVAEEVKDAAPTTPSPAKQLFLNPLQKRRNFHQGARRVLILHLFTGPATELELVRALAWPRHKVHSAIHTCQRDLLVAEEKERPNYFCLTIRGKMAAEYFQKNPARVRFEVTEYTK